MPRKKSTVSESAEVTPETVENAVVMDVDLSEEIISSEAGQEEMFSEIETENEKRDSMENDDSENDYVSSGESTIDQNVENMSEVDISEYDNAIEIEDNDIDDEQGSESSQSTAYQPNHTVASRIANERLQDKYDDNDMFKWAELFQRKAHNVICSATVIKCMKTDGGNVAALCHIEGFEMFNILVPFNMLEADLDIVEGNMDTKIRFVNRLIGSNISIVIEQLKEGTGIGNQKKANYFLRRKFFYRGFKSSQNSTKKIIGKGTIVNDAKIFFVRESAIFVYIFGARVRIPVRELSHNLISDCRAEYTVGSTIRCLIKDIQFLHDEAMNVKISASVKALTNDDTLVALENASMNEVCLATVTQLTYRKGTVLLHTATGYNAIATHIKPYARNIRPGSTVKFQLNKKDGRYGVGQIIQVIAF